VTPHTRLGFAIQAKAFHLHIPLLGSLYLSNGGDFGDKEVSVSIHKDCIRWNLWTPTMAWSSETPKRRNRSFYFIDFILGRYKYSVVEIESRDVLVPMMERSYKGKATLEVASWKRPRWPFTKRANRVEINMDDGEQIPVMGKGENSWDCGEDAIYGTSTHAKTIEQGVGSLVESVLSKRRRYGVPPSISKGQEPTHV